jgi:hypothetical protein
MPQVTGSLIAPRQSAPPAAPSLGQLYYDTDDNRLYWWNGTIWVDATGSAPGAPTIYDSDQIGTVKVWTGRTIPTNWLLAGGQTLNENAGYVDLANFAAAEVAAGNPLWGITGTAPNRIITLPDFRRKMLYGSSTPTSDLGMSYQGGGAESYTLTLGQLPSHQHGPGTLYTGGRDTAHSHSGTTNPAGTHNHGPSTSDNFGTTTGATAALGSGGTSRYIVSNYGWTAYAPDHQHSFSTGTESADHGHAVTSGLTGAVGSGNTINNLPPHTLVAFIIKVLGAAINSGGVLQGATGAPGVKGDPGPWRGAWSAATAYAIGDAVSYYDGTVTASYRRKVAGTTAGNPKTDTTNWEIIASGGSIGAPGAVTVYEQPGDPGAMATGSIWIDTDETPGIWTPQIPLVTSLPGSPYDGQEVYFLADAVAGVIWPLRYRASSPSIYKWEAIGPTPLWVKDDNACVRSLNSYGDPNISGSAGPSITPPLNGDYDVEFGSRFGGVAGGAYMFASPSMDGAVPTDNDALFLYGTNDDMISSRRIRQTGLAGTRVIKLQYKSSAGTNATYDRRHMSVWPVRVG